MKSTAFLLSTLSLALASPILQRGFTGSVTQDDLLDGTPCRAITIIFARGTFEKGNVGLLAGPPFFGAVATMVGEENVAVQGVEYAADVQGFLAGGDAQGSERMAQLVKLAEQKCPGTSIVMSGYSQGGQLVHNAADILGGQVQSISSVVIFGDPDDGQAVGDIPQDKVKIFCDPFDNICQGGALILPAHLSYAKHAQQAAEFVVQHAEA